MNKKQEQQILDYYQWLVLEQKNQCEVEVRQMMIEQNKAKRD